MDLNPLLAHEIPPDAAWSLQVQRGRVLRLTARDAGANLSALLYQARDGVDRMNVPDTLKAQMSACIKPPMTLMSDRGVALASVTASSLDWHDALTGHSLDAHLAPFGPSSYSMDRNSWKRSARFGLTAELAKHGLLTRDLHASVNFFSKVALADDAHGSITFVSEYAAAGDWVTLRAEVDLLFIASTAPHPLDPDWSPGAVLVEVFEGEPYGEDDPSWTFRDETRRSLQAAKAVFA